MEMKTGNSWKIMVQQIWIHEETKYFLHLVHNKEHNEHDEHQSLG